MWCRAFAAESGLHGRLNPALKAHRPTDSQAHYVPPGKGAPVARLEYVVLLVSLNLFSYLGVALVVQYAIILKDILDLNGALIRMLPMLP